MKGLLPQSVLEGSTEDLGSLGHPGIAPSEGIPASQPLNVPTPRELIPPPVGGGFVASRSCMFKITKESKQVRVWLFGVIMCINDYRNFITMLHSLPSDFIVYIYIHSPGGSIQVACNILMAMERCKATIITYNIGMAASCGSLILAFGDKIHVDDLAITMFHNSASGGQDSTHRLLTKTKHLINSVSGFFDRMRIRGVMTEKEIEGIVNRGEEFYLNSDEMKQRLIASNLWYEGGRA